MRPVFRGRVRCAALGGVVPLLLVVSAELCGCSRKTNPDDPPHFVLVFGGPFGSGPGQFRGPNGIATDATGNVYVVDHDNDRIQKFSKGGTLLGQWGGPGAADGQFHNPGRIAVDPSGYVYVTEDSMPGLAGATRIQKFTGSGQFVSSWGTFGRDTGQFITPVGIAAGRSGRIYIADVDNHRIQVMTGSGAFIRAWGDSGTGPGQFQYALELAVDASENVFVLDVGPLDFTARIEKFTSDGRFIMQFGSIGDGEGQFGEPKGLGVDASGHVYVADGGANRIEKFTNDGVFITQWGTPGADPGQLNYPFGVATVIDHDVFVLEPFNYRVSKFSYPGWIIPALETAPER